MRAPSTVADFGGASTSGDTTAAGREGKKNPPPGQQRQQQDLESCVSTRPQRKKFRTRMQSYLDMQKPKQQNGGSSSTGQWIEDRAQLGIFEFVR